ncbi:MAG: Glu/Leu/Phe/Val dehydrogenase [Candidatus Sericytochromatia bacterium]|nr:Glu/Leu/Phe/Val dehydrogenase [Candidatus Sericytochromatia bacterium]
MTSATDAQQLTNRLPAQYRGRKDLLGQARLRLAKAASGLRISEGFQEWIFTPNKVIQTYSPVRLDSGEITVFPGYRVQHSNVLGPYYGGVRFHPEVDLDGVTALALLMSWQCALLGIPFGGAKGGVTADPYQMSQGELERLTRRYTSDMVTVFDPKKDIPRPDISTSGREMAWMMDTLSVNRGYALPAAVTGKPLVIGGTQLAGDSAGKGAYFLLKDFLRGRGEDVRGKRVVIEGFGKLGRVLSQLLYRDGAIIVGVSDRSGAWYSPEGFDVHALLRHVDAHRLLEGVEAAVRMSEEELLQLDCDILVPASLSAQVTRSNAGLIRAGVILECANMPVTPEADRLLAERGIVVLPDLIANAGGVLVGYFEWVQDNNQLFWTEEEVTGRLRDLVLRTWQQVASRAERDGLSYREAAHTIALERLFEAASLRGFYP